MMTSSPRCGSPTGKRRYPHGMSPFNSPMAGDVLEDSHGHVREVVGCSGGIITYLPGASDVYRTCTTKSWAEWCSKKKAKLVSSRAKR